MDDHNSPASVWRVNVEVLKRLLACAAACTCVGVIYMQWTYIWMLRSEMAEITQRFRPLETARDEGGICCDSAVCYGVGECFLCFTFNGVHLQLHQQITGLRVVVFFLLVIPKYSLESKMIQCYGTFQSTVGYWSFKAA